MKLEEYRVKKDLNYEELSTFLGISKVTTYNICKEKRVNNITLKNANIIVSKTFGDVDYPDLLLGSC